MGYDPSPTFINYARDLAKKEELNASQIRFYSGDIKEIDSILVSKGELAFDGIISMDAAFGYSGKIDDDLRLFEKLFQLGSKDVY